MGEYMGIDSDAMRKLPQLTLGDLHDRLTELLSMHPRAAKVYFEGASEPPGAFLINYDVRHLDLVRVARDDGTDIMICGIETRDLDEDEE